ncbi:hypothetical protein EW146_g1258 [Bondarzewia mesenterica]|uniref:Uncharacterized protein n=1 Tax=Bondarzewia mesenterica TaxID=1095465 RepID=A0A4S4M5V5_9AGAM|nr:hypothetical protein EW146_g1258 [Bondarzewia mesenterica]
MGLFAYKHRPDQVHILYALRLVQIVAPRFCAIVFWAGGPSQTSNGPRLKELSSGIKPHHELVSSPILSSLPSLDLASTIQYGAACLLLSGPDPMLLFATPSCGGAAYKTSIDCTIAIKHDDLKLSAATSRELGSVWLPLEDRLGSNLVLASFSSLTFHFPLISPSGILAFWLMGVLLSRCDKLDDSSFLTYGNCVKAIRVTPILRFDSVMKDLTTHLSRPASIRGICLPTQATLRTDLPRNRRHLVCKYAQALRHPVDRLLQVEHLATHIDLDFL